MEPLTFLIIAIVMIITGVAYRLQVDVMWFFGICAAGAAAVYLMNILPYQLNWWIIGKIAGQ